ncbi:MAG: RNA 2',3'-cyclic phosphodiesterase [Candidatus Altiarchaeota archaeon]
MRVFAAIECPDEIRGRLAALQQELKKFGSMRLVERGNIHLTLKFFGEVDRETMEDVDGRLKSLDRMEAFELSLKSVGVFPKADYARVVWAGVDRGGDNVLKANAAIEESVSGLGFERDGGFHPHATLARVKAISDKAGFLSFLQSKKGEDFGQFTVERIVLMESKLTPAGPEYNTRGEYYLK